MKNNFDDHSKKHLTIAFFLIVILFVIVGITSIFSIKSLGNIASQIYRHPLEVSNASLRSSMGIVKMHRSMKDVVLAENQSELESAVSKVKLEEEVVWQYLEIIKKNILGEEGLALAAEAMKMFTDWRPIRQEVISLVKNNQKDAAAKITKGKGADHQAVLEQKMLTLTAYARNKADGFIEKSENIRKKVYLLVIASVITGIGLSIIVALFLSRKLLENIRISQESEERFRLLLEHIGEGVYGLDIDGKCTFANKACAEILGYSGADDFAGKNMHELIHYKRSDGSAYPNYECKIYKSFRKGEGAHVSDELLWKADGTGFPAEYRSFPIFKNKQVVGSVVTFVNINERKQLEEEREELIEKLQTALAEVKTLRGILPLCTYCKKIRDDNGYWEQVDVYINQHSSADISHGICPECIKKHHPEEYEDLVAKGKIKV